MMSSVARRFSKVWTVLALLMAALASTAADAQTDYFWNAPTGGTGTWDTASFNWSTVSAGPVDYTWTNSGNERANFGNTAGTVTLGGPITAYGINLSAANYTIAGNGNTLTLSGTGGVINSNVAASITAQLAGSVGLSKTGSGALTLNNANSYTGSTTVSGGTLIGIAQTSGSPFSSGNVTLNGAVLNLKSLTTNTTTTTVGDLSISAANANTVGVSNLIVDNTGGGPTNTTTLAAGNLSRGGNGSALVITPQTGLLATRELITLNNGNALLTNGILPAWVVATASGASTAGDFVTYGGSGLSVATYAGDLSTSNNTNVVNQTSIPTISGAAAAYALKTNVAVNLNGNTLTLGNGTGQSGLILNNGGSLTNGNITFGATEGMIYSQGIGTDSTLSGSTIVSGPFGTGTLTANNGTNNSMRPINGSHTIANPINMITGFFVQNAASDPSASLTFTGPISLNSTSGRTINNSFTAGTGGTLTLGDPSNPSTISGNPGTLTAQSITFASTGTTIVNDSVQESSGSGLATPITISGAGNATFNGVISTGGLVTISAGGGTSSAPTTTIDLKAMNSYAGGTALTGANTIIPIENSSTGSPGAPTVGPFGTGQINFNNGSNQHLRPVGADKVIHNSILLTTGMAMDNATGESFNLTFAGPVTMTNNRFISNGFIGSTTGGTMIMGDPSAPSTITLPVSGNFTLSLAALSGPILVNDVIQDASGQAGNVAINPNTNNNNPVTLNAQNTYSGNTTIGASGLGAVQIGVSSIGSPGSITSGPFGTGANGTVNMTNTSATPPPLTPFGADRTVANAINLNSGNMGAANASGQTFNLELTGPISTGTVNRTIYNNMVGTLSLGSAGSPNSISLSQQTGIQLNFAGTGTTVVNDLIQDNFSATAAGNITVQNGTVKLTNANSYTGTTTVTGGVLQVNNTTGSGTGPGAVTVNGGTLGGSGFIGGAVTVNSGGHLNPGASPGKLTINNSVAFTTGSNFDVEIGGTNPGVTYDQLVVDTTAALDGSLNVSLVNGFVDPAVNTDFTILTATGGVSGIFSNLSFPDANWSVIYNANSVIARFTAPAAGLAGDFNSDGKVDAADYVMWRKNNGTNNALANDGGLGTPIGPAHYNLWRANFGKPPGAGSGGGLAGGAVPEPATVVTLLIAAAASMGFRRKR